ncbi:hypothetical protein CVT26_007356 [Gymnopilus dilepis]|uniref:Uncharacterized protein n=1 Tax=Gymnopilus dilepis TaxID=231916 RepID=A0A409VP73_9AGAR|nr:hypothetical protein CVT26_007356 [Gymnopilus dilepis]
MTCNFCNTTDASDFDPSQCSTMLGNSQCEGCRELENLEAQIRDAYDTLRQLKRKRFPVKEKVNQLHDPFSRYGVPVEIILRVFELCIDTPQHSPIPQSFDYSADGFATPLLISAVCRRWRQVALAAPGLWTSLKVLLREGMDPTGHGELMQQWLLRSGTRPLHLVVYDKTSLISTAHQQFAQGLLNATKAQAHRWKSLTVSASAHLYSSIIGGVSSAPLLKSITLDGLATESDLFCIPDTPSLEQLRLRGPFLKSISMQWNHITTFQMEMISKDEIFELLRRAEQLEICKLTKVFPGLTGFDLPESPLLHRCLKDLQIEFKSEVLGGFYSFLLLPSLTHLAMSLRLSLVTDEFIALCTGSSIQAFEFRDFFPNKVTDSDLIRILEHMPTLKRLSLFESHTHEIVKFRMFGRPGFSWVSFLEALKSIRNRSQQLESSIEDPTPAPRVTVKLHLYFLSHDETYVDAYVLSQLVDPAFRRDMHLEITDEKNGRDLIKASLIHHGFPAS